MSGAVCASNRFGMSFFYASSFSIVVSSAFFAIWHTIRAHCRMTNIILRSNNYYVFGFFMAFWIGEENANPVKKAACDKIDREEPCTGAGCRRVERAV